MSALDEHVAAHADYCHYEDGGCACYMEEAAAELKELRGQVAEHRRLLRRSKEATIDGEYWCCGRDDLRHGGNCELVAALRQSRNYIGSSK